MTPTKPKVLLIASGDSRLSSNRLCWSAQEEMEEEIQRRLDSTTPVWPIMHGVTYGTSRDQMMAQHQANHIQVAYATDTESADRALLARAAFAHHLGIQVNLCGTRKNSSQWD